MDTKDKDYQDDQRPLSERIRQETNASWSSSAEARRQSQEAETRRLIRQELDKEPKPKKQSLLSIFALVLVGAVLGSFVTWGGLHAFQSGQSQETPSPDGDQAGQAQEIVIHNDGEGQTIENAVAKKAIPSIVGITTIQKSWSENPFLFGVPGYSESVGSGVIVSKDGYIVTNSHVVGGGQVEKVKVLLSDDQEMEARVLWADPTLDLAMIKIDRADLVPITFAKDPAQVGDKAIALGNPLGLDLQSTLTSGYISGLDRSISLEDGNTMDGLIQTDAAINGGNSGGALLNAKGELVGINTAKPRSADGIGFAIPSASFQTIVEKIVRDGSYTPLYLGISGLDVRLAAQMGMANLPTEKGVVIRSVAAGSPAEKAGLQAGDIVISLADQAVDSMNSLKKLLLNYKEGDTVTIGYYRSREKQETQLTFHAFTFPKES